MLAASIIPTPVLRHRAVLSVVVSLCAVFLAQASQSPRGWFAISTVHAESRVEGWWAQLIRPADLWSGPNAAAQSFGQMPRGAYLRVLEEQPLPGGARLYVQETEDFAFGYVDAISLAPSSAPPLHPATDAGALPAVVGAPLFQPFWVANHTPSTLWSSPNEGDAGVDNLPQYSKLLVLAPSAGSRFYVQEPRSERLGYVEVAHVGPSDPPTAAELEPPPSIIPPATPSYRPWWIASHRVTNLWSAMDAGVSFGSVAIGEHLLVMAPQSGPRLHVLNPKTRNYAFVDAAAVGPATPPKAAAIEVKGWRGVVTGDVVNLRPEPYTFIPHAGQVRSGDEVTVTAWVEGEEIDKDNRTWARLTSVKRRNSLGELVELLTEEHAGPRYIYSSLLRPTPVSRPPEPPNTALGAGGARWIDVNLTHQTITAYEGTRPVYFAPVTSGRPGWETPTGTYRFTRRVENETMIGSTLLRLDTYEIPSYRLENVKWTQYFTGAGAALHTNYWRPAALFGMPSSHGCLGVEEQHAKWFWDWARIGTQLLIHY
jgi:lipoprotein-anchoring transpeptidase ErfK/SrfK